MSASGSDSSSVTSEDSSLFSANVHDEVLTELLTAKNGDSLATILSELVAEVKLLRVAVEAVAAK